MQRVNVKRTKEEIEWIRNLSQQKLFPWLFDAMLDWLIIAAAMYFAVRCSNIVAYLCAIFVVGNRQHALAILGHDGAHSTIHKNKRFNDFLANLFCFWPLLITIEGYRRLHSSHHKNTGTADDPELLHKKARSPQWDLPFRFRKLSRYVLLDCIGYSLPDLFIILTFSKPDNPWRLLPVVVLHLSLVAISLLFGIWWLPVVWYGSLATSFMIFFRLRLWLEHQGMVLTQRIHLTPLQGMILSPHKAWLHWEHHRYPALPYHKLERARSFLAVEPTVIDLRKLIENLRKVDFSPSGAVLRDSK